VQSSPADYSVGTPVNGEVNITFTTTPANQSIIDVRTIVGQQGETGATGPSGLAGPAGGPSGATGATGATGFGATGATGATGPSGATGPTGAIGLAGATGFGATGATGPRGATGSANQALSVSQTFYGTGITTAFGPITMGTVASRAGYFVTVDGVMQHPLDTVYSTPYVTNPQTLVNEIYVIFVEPPPLGMEIIVRVLMGDAGATGSIGPTGIQGATGPSGLQGATGPIGISGITGATGVKGSTGSTGPSGTQGDTGATGSTGPAGSIASFSLLKEKVTQDNTAANGVIDFNISAQQIIYKTSPAAGNFSINLIDQNNTPLVLNNGDCFTITLLNTNGNDPYLCTKISALNNNINEIPVKYLTGSSTTQSITNGVEAWTFTINYQEVNAGKPSNILARDWLYNYFVFGSVSRFK
jgi:hypothetical protein